MLVANDIFDSLLADRSKENVSFWVTQMINKGFSPDSLMDLVRKSKPSEGWKITWLLSHYMEATSDGSFQNGIWKLLQQTKHQGIQRDLWRALSFVKIEESIAGEVYDTASKMITSQMHPIANRAHAMLCAFNISQQYPELQEELKTILLGISPEDSAGIKARAKNILKKL